MSILTVEIDLARNVFAIDGVDETGKAVLVNSIPGEVGARRSGSLSTPKDEIAGCDWSGRFSYASHAVGL
ncbi:hypothetical protein BGLT_05245 [Caballeronia glathei]|jgi:hypothetical protein|uniref:hypothetical protein n=1 Tax=Caballeronia glathei TaxID=60547 RepID=UPI0005012D7E|nr:MULTISPECIES: hypothetical protein [Burkholderiaceae]TCK35375.1 hypothetical protein B0G84_7378 [Paraburkholderia sp. BL8N3]CDY76172.1 hypothetical protein BGLT_05245 [Caballeronia glathei]